MAVPANFVQQQGQGSASADQMNTFVQMCTNTPTLRTFVGVSNMTVFLLGQTTPGDGGQGTFWWNSTSTAVDDNFNVITPTSAGAMGRWLRVPQLNLTNQIAFEVLGGTPPTSSQILGGYVFPVITSFGVNLTSYAGQPVQWHNEVSPAGSFVIQIFHIAAGISTNIGTMTISTGGLATVAVVTAQTFLIGDSIKFVAPSSTDASLVNFWWTLLGNIST